jgi:hypothetical protein
VTLRNTGWRTGRAGVAIVEGADGAAASFVLADPQACVGPVPGDGRCTLALRFEPARPGPHQGVLRVQGLALAVPVAGNASAGRLEAEPPGVLDFGSTEVDAAPVQRTLTLRNAGDAPLAVRPADTLAPPFELRADGCLGRDLAPGASCSLRLAYRPRQGGGAQAVLRLAGDVPGQGPLEIPLRGMALAPGWTLEPAELAFGDVQPGEAAPLRRLRLRSTGTGSLRLGAARLEGAAGGFAIADDGCSGRTLAPGAECEITGRALAGGARGQRSARLVLDAGSAGRVSVPWSGLWRGGELATEPAALDFGRVAYSVLTRLNPRGPEQELRVVNRGDAPLRPGPVSIVGARPASFGVVGGSCDAVLAPGAACTLRLRFVPRDSGRAEALLSFTGTGADGRPLTVALTGLGSADPPPPAPAAQPARLEARLPPDGLRVECTRGGSVPMPMSWRGPADTRVRVVMGALGTVWEGTGSGALVNLPCRPGEYRWQVETVGVQPPQQSTPRSLTLALAAPPAPSAPAGTRTVPGPAAPAAIEVRPSRSSVPALQRTEPLASQGACCLEQDQPPRRISAESCSRQNGRWYPEGSVPQVCKLYRLN